jgi:hypothetical protein
MEAQVDNAVKPKAGPADLEWIARNGSSRLLKIVEAGLLDWSWGVYAEEHLRKTRPELYREGWRACAHELRSVRNPEEAWIDALLAAREQIDPNITLMFAPALRQALLLWNYRGAEMSDGCVLALVLGGPHRR